MLCHPALFLRRPSTRDFDGDPCMALFHVSASPWKALNQLESRVLMMSDENILCPPLSSRRADHFDAVAVIFVLGLLTI